MLVTRPSMPAPRAQQMAIGAVARSRATTVSRAASSSGSSCGACNSGLPGPLAADDAVPPPFVRSAAGSASVPSRSKRVCALRFRPAAAGALAARAGAGADCSTFESRLLNPISRRKSASAAISGAWRRPLSHGIAIGTAVSSRISSRPARAVSACSRAMPSPAAHERVGRPARMCRSPRPSSHEDQDRASKRKLCRSA